MTSALLTETPQGQRTQVPSPGLAGRGTWMEVLSHLDPIYGGLTAMVPSLASTLQQQSAMDIRLAAFCAPSEQQPSAPASALHPSLWPAGHLPWLRESQLRRGFSDEVSACDGVHIHGLWQASMRIASGTAGRLRKPYIVSAHGMLDPWALAQKVWKKRIYAALFERAALQKAAWLHALTLAEAEDYRRFGCTGPIAVIPNAVEAPEVVDETLLDRHWPETAGKRVVLYMGRLHKKKGVEMLLEAWSRIAGDAPDALLVVAGPGDPAYAEQLQVRASSIRGGQAALFTGMLQGSLKWSALKRAHTFVLPSYSEGLSVASLEALSVGTPVIVTHECHLPEVVAAGCGWQIPSDITALELALREALEASETDRTSMGRRAQQLGATRFSWSTVCAQMTELYECVLGGGAPQLSPTLEAMR